MIGIFIINGEDTWILYTSQCSNGNVNTTGENKQSCCDPL